MGFDGMSKGLMRMDDVAILSSDALSFQDPCRLEVGHDPLNRSFRNPDPQGHFPEFDPRV